TGATLCVFILAMALNPEVLRKAQNEINTVVGPGHLPKFEHQAAIPYCEAVIREISRWRPIAPLGLAHTTSEDDIYEGY
ncbi:cytochrome P450, partial [Mycena galopus ATCC 62051]